MAQRVSIIGTTETDESLQPSFTDDELMMFEKLFMEEGVISGLEVTQNGTPNMTVNVAAGVALVQITNTNLTGETYLVYVENLASESVPVTTADATNPRKDRLVLEVLVNTNPNVASSNVGRLRLIAGTPAGSPSAPAEPSNCITLRIIDIPAGDTTIGTSQITGTPPYATLDPDVLADVIRAANLASTATGKGASLVGIEDTGAHYVATNAEAALQEVPSLIARGTGLYGDGNDGAPNWASGASLNPSTEKRYTTATLPSGQSLTASSANGVLIIHNTGSVTIEGTVDMNGKGGPGGNGGATNGAPGSAGTAGTSLISGLTTGAGGGAGTGTTGAGGGGGGSIFAAGTVGNNGNSSTGGAAGAIMASNQLAFLSTIFRGLANGAGGGGGSTDNGSGGGVAGNGGNGGGALVWYIGGNLTLGASSVVRANGDAGANATGAANGGGGGGAGGVILILVAGSITNNGVTASASGGAGGARTGASAGNGSAGAAGKVVIYSLSTGTLITA